MGREGCCKQITLACARSVSSSLGMPLHTAHTAQALRCSSGNRLRPALGCMHLPGLSHSGSLSGSPQRRRFGWACVLCPSQDRVARVFGERGRCDLPPFPAAQFSGCTAGSPSQADGGCPEPQEVLVKKPACSLVGNVSLGPRLSLPALPALDACHRRGMVCSRLFLFCPLFSVRSWWCLMFERFTW